MTNLPRRKSAAIDVWGFYNGKNDNTGLSPYSEVYSASSVEYGQPINVDFNSTLGEITLQLSNYTQHLGSDGYEAYANRIFGWGGSSTTYLYNVKPLSRPNSGNRQPSATHLMEGSLYQIDYPTGGNTQFEYEAHKYKGKIEEFKLFYPLQQQACTWCTLPSANNSYNNCTAPSGVGVSCIRDIKIKNVQILSGTPTNKMLFGLSLDNLGIVSYGMTFGFIVKKNGVVIKTGNFALPTNQKKKIIVDGFLSTFWNGSSILPTDIIDIDILRTSVNGTPDTLCDLKFQVFYPTFGIVEGDKIAGGLRVKKVTTSEGTDMTKTSSKNMIIRMNQVFSLRAFLRPKYR